MKIAILGTRGIPNNYGGFEQFAEFLSVGLIENGCQVSVYNSHRHPFKESFFKGVEIIHCYDPEHIVGTAGQFVYDFNCIMDARKRNFDIILQLGYTSSSVWSFLMPSQSIITTNMDGLEWKRTKYSKKVQKFLLFAEKLAVQYSDFLISDSLGIQSYILEKYGKESCYIPYGADLFEKPNQHALTPYNVNPYEYNMLIARLEPENSIEVILDGVCQSQTKVPFYVVGNYETKFGKYLKNKYNEHKSIIFLGSIYNQDTLNNLRFYSNLYFHGHTVGGTNPSLLEAMASGALVCAHDNPFNKAILEMDAFYFISSNDVADCLNKKNKREFGFIIENNFKKIKEKYTWEAIISQYSNHFNQILEKYK
jgi:glycosyltransferase involved in cell wall biosynthesis